MHGSAALVLWLLSACLADSSGSHCMQSLPLCTVHTLIQSGALFPQQENPKRRKRRGQGDTKTIDLLWILIFPPIIVFVLFLM